ncbi:glycoside hydrolase family 16 protein [Plicaturopsis crispa FD-325 SS-3]|nr:glycoside hydrolase family 16 protein [Plicaturopsis crispa FD-325 SS-3]
MQILGGLTVTLALVAQALCTSYSRTDSFIGPNFYTAFTFQTAADPTGGRVNYVNQSFAQSTGLTVASDNGFILRGDDKATLAANGTGRNSVRIRSIKTYTTHVAVFSVRHTPEGCGTWPAIWEAGDHYPTTGETDIFEGVNNRGVNQATLHTTDGCTMPSSNRTMTGTAQDLDCSISAVQTYKGCGVAFAEKDSYGPSLNTAGGGWYAIERTNAAISIWFWDRNSANVPLDVAGGLYTVNPATWGTPSGFWPNSTTCNIGTHFAGHHIIVNLDFCGSYAGSSSVYASSGCPSTCIDYVNNNPSAFTNAYFDFEFIKVYQ